MSGHVIHRPLWRRYCRLTRNRLSDRSLGQARQRRKYQPKSIAVITSGTLGEGTV